MNEEPKNETAIEPAPKAPLLIQERGIVLRDIDSLWRFSTMVQQSGLAPKGIETVQAICVAIQMGMECGLTPMAALQNIAVINGRPSIWGDAQLGICRATGELAEFVEWFEVDGKALAAGRSPSVYADSTTAVCRVRRAGYRESSEATFSVADAKRANLWGKQGPWSQYPGRMLKFRARSFALRDTFGDALRGFRTAEEVQDLPAIEVESETVTVGTSEPTPEQPTKAKEAEPAKAEPKAEEPTSEPAAGATPQVVLRHIVVNAGHSLQTLVDYLVDQGHLDQAVTGWDFIPDAVAKRMVKAQKGLLAALAAKGQKQ